MAEGNSGWKHDTSFDAQGNLEITSESKLGNPQILGVIVTPLESLKFFAC
jgi:hypothetical protein